MDEIDGAGTVSGHAPMGRGALGAWWWQGLRSALLMRPDWRGLQATPSVLAWLVIVPTAASLLFERLYIDGPASFYWAGLLVGWLSTAVGAWVSWLLVPHPRPATTGTPPSAAALFAMMSAQGFSVVLLSGLLFVPMARNGLFALPGIGAWLGWASMILFVGWQFLIVAALVWRSGEARAAPRWLASFVMLAALGLHVGLRPPSHWYPLRVDSSDSAEPEPFRLTQELTELQPQLLQTRLQALGAGRPGKVDLYAVTFAPYAPDEVFHKESEMVAALMQERFGSGGKTVQLVNHQSTARDWPWATPLNLQRTIQRIAQQMNRDEDVLFIHLTSHGARNGQLSADFWPLSVDSVTPSLLKGWLDEAGIRWRVISVSACYSGSWIEPLAGPGTLVMTAADADHTSYGCGRGSSLTYFGRAMFDEQLRRTRSFEEAHAAARTLIEERERLAGKSDGFSNPQIRVGEGIRGQLAKMEAERNPAAPESAH